MNRALFASAAIAAAALVSSACGPEAWRAPSVVRLTIDDQIGSLLPEWFSWFSDAAAVGEAHALLLRDGDFIVGSEFGYRYRAADGVTLALSFADGILRVGGRVVSIDVDQAAARQWLSSASGADLAALRILGAENAPDPQMAPRLKALAAANPRIDLLLETTAAARALLPMFRPRALLLGEEVEPAAHALIPGDELEMLAIFDAGQPGALTTLPHLPRLKQLLLSDWDPPAAGALPATLTALESLAITGAKGVTDLAGLRNAPASLSALSLIGWEQLADLRGIERFTQLHTVILTRDQSLSDPSALASLPELRWVAPPSSMTQEQFASFAAAHSKLEVLDLMHTPNITSLAPIARLPLQAIIVAGPVSDLSVLRSMPSLRFVGIGHKVWDEAGAGIPALRQALPDAAVVRVRPFCLGSGWILLLAPIIVIAARRPRGAFGHA
jgi:hypothetical protein